MKPQSSFTIQKEWLQKNKEEAFAMNKDFGVLAFDFGTPEEYYILSERQFKLFLDLLEKENEK